MNQPAKIRKMRLENQAEQEEMSKRLQLGDVAIAESVRERLPTIDDWLASKREELEQAFVSVNLAEDGAIARIAAVQAQQAILRELDDLMQVAKENERA